MARTIGKVEFNVDFDGKGLPARARAIGEEAGDEMGKGTKKGFGKNLTSLSEDLRKQMKKDGGLAGTDFEKSLRNKLARSSASRSDLLANIFGDKKQFAEYAKNFDTPIDAIEGLRNELRELDKDGGISKDRVKAFRTELTSLRAEFVKTGRNTQRVTDSMNDVGRAVRQMQIEISGAEYERQSRSIDRFGKALRDLNPEVEADRKKFDKLRDTFNRIDLDGQNRDVKKLARSFEDLGGSFDVAAESRKRLARDIELDGAVEGHAYGESIRRAAAKDLRGMADDVRKAFSGTDADLERHLNGFDDLTSGVAHYRGQLRELQSNGHIPDTDFRNLNSRLTSLVVSQRLASRESRTLRGRLRGLFDRGFDRDIDGHSRTMSRFQSAMQRVLAPSRAFQKAWRSAPHGLKQGAFYVGLFAGLAPGIAALGSVAGSSLAVLGTGLLAVGTGAAVAVAGFKGMLGDLSEVAPAARPAAEALQGLADPLHDLQQTIQGRMFKGLDDEFTKIGTVLIPGLTKGLGGVSGAVGDVFGELLRGLESKGGIRTMNDLLLGFQPIIRDLGGAFGQLAAAFAHIFVAALPTAQKFFGFLNDLFTRFNEWTTSVAGQDRLERFFGTLNTLAGPLADLIGAAGNALAGMVTPDSVKNFADFLGTMTDVLPGIKDIVNIVDKLDPLGIAAEALKSITDVIGPNKKAFEDLALTIGDFVKGALPQLTPILKDLVGAALPLANAIADQLAPAIQPLIDRLPQLTQNIEDLTGAFDGLTPSIGPLAQVLGGLGDIFQISQPLAALPGAINAVTDSLSKFGNIDFSHGPLSSLLQIDNAVSDTISNIGAAFLAPGQTFLNGIVNAFKGSDVGKSIVDGVVEGVKNAAGAVWEAAANSVYGKAIEAFKNAFGIHSPSTKFRDIIGIWIIPGIIEGFLSNVGDLGTTIMTSLSGIFESLAPGVLQKVVDLFNGAPEAIGQALAGINPTISGIFSQIGDGVAAVPEKISTFLGGIGEKIGGFFAPAVPLVEGTKQSLLGIWQSLDPETQAALEGAGVRIANQFADVVPSIGRLGNQVISNIGTLPGRAVSAVSGIGSQVASQFNSAPGTVAGIVSDIVGKFSGIGGRIVSQIGNIGARIGGAFSGAASSVEGVISSIVGKFSGLGGRISSAIGNIGATIAAKLNFSNAVKLPKTATGGVFNGSQARIIGEAGPEAVVPLNRPLNQVDPAVRALSAYAQGLSSPGVSGVGRSVSIAEGAITVLTPASDPALVAEQMLDRLVASIG